MLINNQNYLHGRLVGIGKIRKDGSREFRFLEKSINNMILRCGLNEFMTYNGSNSATSVPGFATKEPWSIIEYCGFGTSGAANDFANTNTLAFPAITPYSTREKRNWPFVGLRCGNKGQDDSFKIRISHLSPSVSEDISVREIGYFKSYNSNYYLFSRIVLPSAFQLDVGDSLITTYELVVFNNRTPFNMINCGLHDANNIELGCQLSQRITFGESSSYVNRPENYSTGWGSGSYSNGRPYLHAPHAFYAYPDSGNASTAQEYFTLRYTKSQFNFPTTNSILFSYRSRGEADRCSNQSTIYTPDSFKRDIIVNVPAYWPEMSNNTDYRDIYAINWGTLFVRFGHFDANMDFTPAPWRKLASRTAKFVFRQSIATQDSIAWQQQQNYGVN